MAPRSGARTVVVTPATLPFGLLWEKSQPLNLAQNTPATLVVSSGVSVLDSQGITQVIEHIWIGNDLAKPLL
jgi:hypothetical protein